MHEDPETAQQDRIESLLLEILEEIQALRQWQEDRDRQQGAPRLLWMRDVVELIGRSRRKVEEWLRDGRLSMRKVDGEWCIHSATFERNLRELVENGDLPGKQKVGRPRKRR